MKTATLSGLCALVLAAQILAGFSVAQAGVVDSAPVNADGTINALVEIPAGTNEKWEMDKDTGKPEIEIKDGKPRIVRYLGYPGNYGMIPGTLMPSAEGGDGDPLDVLVIGLPAQRGSIVAAKLIGALKFMDKGEVDDKLLAIAADSPLASVESLAELQEKYIGVDTIIKTWFENYKGPGKMKFMGYASREESQKILERAIDGAKSAAKQ